MSTVAVYREVWPQHRTKAIEAIQLLLMVIYSHGVSYNTIHNPETKIQACKDQRNFGQETHLKQKAKPVVGKIHQPI